MYFLDVFFFLGCGSIIIIIIIFNTYIALFL